ncbi:MAG: glycosyltransferase family 4 protein [Thermoanaerobaculia bacterium]
MTRTKEKPTRIEPKPVDPGWSLRFPSDGRTTDLFFVGPMVGSHPGFVTVQPLILARCFKEAGYRVAVASSCLNRYIRFFDIQRRLLQSGRSVRIQCLGVYGGRSFVLEDVASWLGKRLGQRVVMVLHGGALPGFMARFPRWTRRVLGRADALVTPSPYLARALEQAAFRAIVIPNVIDIGIYPYRHRRNLRPRLFWMRTFHPIWNPEMAIRVLALLRREFPNASLVMAGQDNGMKQAVERLAVRLGVRAGLSFPGFLDMAGKIREGNSADIFLTTNRIDNMPVAVLEAAAMGLPVVATEVGGIPDLLTDGETALLVPDDDPEAMAAAVRRLLVETDLAGRLSANGRRLAERSSWDDVRPMWEKVFEEVLRLPEPPLGMVH